MCEYIWIVFFILKVFLAVLQSLKKVGGIILSTPPPFPPQKQGVPKMGFFVCKQNFKS